MTSIKKGNRMNRYLLAIPAAIALTLVAAPAYATDPEPYVIAAWTINTPGFDGTGDVWGGGGQTDPITAATASTDLDQIKSSVPCGRWVQIDLYNNDELTASLIARGHLYGPSNPQESPATDVSPWYIASWWSGDCIQPPDDETPGHTDSVPDCVNHTVTVTNWKDVVTYVGDKYGWVAQPAVRVFDERTVGRVATAVECPPVVDVPECGTAGTLACTPGGEYAPWIAYLALSIIAVGLWTKNPRRLFR